MPDIGDVSLHREIAALRKKVKDLRLEASGLRLVTEALCEDLWKNPESWPPIMAIAIPHGDEPPFQDFAGNWHNLGRYKALAEEGQQIAEAIGKEVNRLKGLFGNRSRCGPKAPPW